MSANHELYYLSLSIKDSFEWVVTRLKEYNVKENLSKRKLDFSVFMFLIITFEYLIYLGIRERNDHD